MDISCGGRYIKHILLNSINKIDGTQVITTLTVTLPVHGVSLELDYGQTK